MFELIADVEVLVQDELERANKKFPLFRSRHEGVAVIEEEVYEVSNDYRDMCNHFSILKERVFRDKENINTSMLEYYACLLACEAIQVAAMARKFRKSKEEMK